MIIYVQEVRWTYEFIPRREIEVGELCWFLLALNNVCRWSRVIALAMKKNCVWKKRWRTCTVFIGGDQVVCN